METLDLWLDDYNDIYSDFDPRHYSKRRISEDFIGELKSAFANKKEFIFDIVLCLPEDKREQEQEPLVAESLHNYFLNRQVHQDLLVRKKRTSAWLLIFSGVLAMAAGTFINYRIENSMLSHFLKILVEPAGWFMLWMGLDALFYELKQLGKEAKLFRELAKAKWHFKSTASS